MGIFNRRQPQDLATRAEQEQEKERQRQEREQKHLERRRDKYERKGIKRLAEEMGASGLVLSDGKHGQARIIVNGQSLLLEFAAEAKIASSSYTDEDRKVSVSVTHDNEVLGAVSYQSSSNRFRQTQDHYQPGWGLPGFLSAVHNILNNQLTRKHPAIDPYAPALSDIAAVAPTSDKARPQVGLSVDSDGNVGLGLSDGFSANNDDDLDFGG